MSDLVSVEALERFVRDELDGDQALFDRLMVHFESHLSEVESSSTGLEAMVSIAHKARASCRSFGALKLEARLCAIEVQGRRGNEALALSELEDARTLVRPTVEAVRSIAKIIFSGIKKSA